MGGWFGRLYHKKWSVSDFDTLRFCFRYFFLIRITISRASALQFMQEIEMSGINYPALDETGL